ncbi:MAG: class I SAM-dependent methyltransferase [Jatrophihabitantaceae bacterium]
MNRHDFLSGIHAAYKPRSYLEIGINDGRGLRRSRTRTIGVDPSFRIVSELACDLQLVKATSDDFFARDNPISWFPEGVVDFSFIDGLHIFEFALRDFMNAERLSSPHSVIVFDDMLPRSVAEAARDRHTNYWTWDVYKVATVLERYRPDLVTLVLDTEPTGLLLVLGADPNSTVLKDRYDEILAEYVSDDPQDVPDAVLHRTAAADPFQVLASPVWSALAQARDAGAERVAVDEVAALRGTARYVVDPPDPGVWPPVKARAKTPPNSPAAARDGSASALVHRVRKAIKRRL